MGIISILFILVGILYLILSIFPTVNCDNYFKKHVNLEPNSLLFFGTIANNDFDAFKTRFDSVDKDTLLNDLLSQIYLNSCICEIKFKRYKKGFFFSVLGVFIFILLALIACFKA
ncbi:Pycsar system effector family protein [Phascolarctobacterium faecium]|uniref:Pycsar system effector family protein n=1 Tax=Phascolarctobacterium faecium TaxID=33025 RepID=UPI0034A0560F